MFLMFRLFRNLSPRAALWLIVAIVAVGVVLVVYGLVDHSTILAVRGALFLVVAAVIGVRMWRRVRLRGSGTSSAPP